MQDRDLQQRLRPFLLRFANKPPASLFWGQAASEVGVLTRTDFKAADRESQSLAALLAIPQEKGGTGTPCAPV